MSGTGPDTPRGLFLSVDVDSLDLYLGLYGQRAGDRAALVAATYEKGVARFLELFAEFSLPATFFAVGRDLDFGAARTVLREAVAKGHSVGNHTLTHPYELIRQPEQQARAEIVGGHEAISRVVGRPPVVFRAPGYNMTDREYRILEEEGYRYDASPLPSYPYLFLKYAVMGGLRLRGRKSHSIWGNPRGFLGARQPYPRGTLTVLPCAATPWLRLPVIGTALSTAPAPLYDYLVGSLARSPFVGLEFHAVDLMELAADELPEALAAQKDLAVPLARKWERFRDLLARLCRDHQPFSPEEP